MKAYLIVTGTVFGLLALAHVWRVVAEGPHALANPWFIFTTLLAAGMCGWAWRLLRSAPRA